MQFSFKSFRKYLSGIPFKKLAYYYFIFSLLTILVLFPDLVFFMKNNVINYAISGFVLVQMLLFIPVLIFCRILKVYYWILGIIIMLIPIMLMPVYFWNIQVNTEMVGLLPSTSIGEVVELLGWGIILMVLGMAFFLWLAIKLSRQLPSRISWKHGLLISLLGITVWLVFPLLRTTDSRYYTSIIRNTYRTFYPFRLQTTFTYLMGEMDNMRRYSEATRNFRYNTVSLDTAKTDSTRKIFLMIIGEASREDHWSINGYHRKTDPELAAMDHLISFKNVVSGGTMTILSVPQLITRAEPENFELHKKEKSILAAFDEAGYFSAWVSNQSQFGLWGNIGMHFHDGDTSIFSGHGENETNFTGNYDATILPIIENQIENHPEKNIFLIVHLIGSHWRYLLRYPPEFEKFKPTSDRNRALASNPSREEIINEYDNSILYTDYILSSIADLLKQYGAVSGFMFISDHGENLGENNTYFHSYKPTWYTAKVPLFFWFNDKYAATYPSVLQNLEANKDKKVSSAISAFYTMLDISRLRIDGFDSTKSLARDGFQPGEQLIIGDGGKIYHFDALKKAVN